MRIIISGGGTGGHIYPAVAIIEKLKEEIDDLEVLYVGTIGGLEEDIIGKLNYNFKAIDSAGIPRKINKKLFKSITSNFRGFMEAKKIIKEFKPDIVVGTGGYVCAPIVYQASKHHIPTLIHESNSYPGLANKFLSKFVDCICITYESCRKHFKTNKEIYLTGNPVRSNLDCKLNETVYEKLKIDKTKPVVFSFGGSNGSYYLNEAIIEMSKSFKGEFNILHATGKKNYDYVANKITDHKMIHLFNYIDDVALFYTISDLIITSSGAMTLAEISSVKKASILIPKSYTTENHQEFNALTYVKEGASEMILEKDLNASILYDKILSIINDGERLKYMGEMAGKLKDDDALLKIISKIRQLAKK